MDEARIEHEGIQPIQAELQRIAAIKRVIDLGPLMAQLDRMGVDSPFAHLYTQTPSSPQTTRFGLPKAVWDYPTVIII